MKIEINPVDSMQYMFSVAVEDLKLLETDAGHHASAANVSVLCFLLQQSPHFSAQIKPLRHLMAEGLKRGLRPAKNSNQPDYRLC